MDEKKFILVCLKKQRFISVFGNQVFAITKSGYCRTIGAACIANCPKPFEKNTKHPKEGLTVRNRTEP